MKLRLNEAMTIQSFIKALDARAPSKLPHTKTQLWVSRAEAIHSYDCATCHFTKANKKKYGSYEGPCTCGAEDLQENLDYWLSELRAIADIYTKG